MGVRVSHSREVPPATPALLPRVFADGALSHQLSVGSPRGQRPSLRVVALCSRRGLACRDAPQVLLDPSLLGKTGPHRTPREGSEFRPPASPAEMSGSTKGRRQHAQLCFVQAALGG